MGLRLAPPWVTEIHTRTHWCLCAPMFEFHERIVSFPWMLVHSPPPTGHVYRTLRVWVTFFKLLLDLTPERPERREGDNSVTIQIVPETSICYLWPLILCRDALWGLSEDIRLGLSSASPQFITGPRKRQLFSLTFTPMVSLESPIHSYWWEKVSDLQGTKCRLGETMQILLGTDRFSWNTIGGFWSQSTELPSGCIPLCHHWLDILFLYMNWVSWLYRQFQRNPLFQL